MVRRGNEDELNRAKLGMSDLCDRLQCAAAQGLRVEAWSARLAEEKLEHCARRAEAHNKRGVIKGRDVFAEVFTGRYRRFSNSWRSILLDLLF